MTHKRRKGRGLPDRLDREKENKMTPPPRMVPEKEKEIHPNHKDLSKVY